jgi:hypothetical protein
MFIDLYMFRATMCLSSGETTVFMRHFILVTQCGWLSGMQAYACVPDSHPHKITSTKCCINTVVSPDDGHIFARNLSRLINVLRKIVNQVGSIYKVNEIRAHFDKHGQRSIFKFMCSVLVHIGIFFYKKQQAICLHLTRENLQKNSTFCPHRPYYCNPHHSAT